MDEVKEKVQHVEREIKENEDVILKAERSIESELNDVLKIELMDMVKKLVNKLMDKGENLRDKEKILMMRRKC